MTDVTGIVLADLSRYQGLVDWPAYAAAVGRTWTYGGEALLGASAAIIKATEGTSYVDPRFAANRAAMRRSLRLRGYYHFYSATQPVRTQAEHFAATIGHLEPGEFAVLDVEQDAEHTRHEQLCAIVDDLVGGRCWLYGGRQVRTTRPLWIARYYDETPRPGGEPQLAHVLWQFTSKGRYPGVAGDVDLNVHRGDIDSLARYAVQPEQEDDVALDAADIKKIGDHLLDRLFRDTTHDYTVAYVRDRVRDLGEKVGAGGGTIDYDLLADKVADRLATRLAQ